jgi:hypothetical protein
VVIKAALHLVSFFYPGKLSPLEVGIAFIQKLRDAGAEFVVGAANVGDICFPAAELEHAQQTFGNRRYIFLGKWHPGCHGTIYTEIPGACLINTACRVGPRFRPIFDKPLFPFAAPLGGCYFLSKAAAFWMCGPPPPRFLKMRRGAIPRPRRWPRINAQWHRRLAQFSGYMPDDLVNKNVPYRRMCLGVFTPPRARPASKRAPSSERKGSLP